MESHFGEHLTIDGYGGDETILNDKEFILNCLRELPGMVEMKTLFGPEIVRAPDTGHKDPGGWSGFVIIQESHISIHTFPRRQFLSADIYSCKNGIDTEKIKTYFKDKFQLQEIESHFIKRGTKYPDHNIF